MAAPSQAGFRLRRLESEVRAHAAVNQGPSLPVGTTGRGLRRLGPLARGLGREALCRQSRSLAALGTTGWGCGRAPAPSPRCSGDRTKERGLLPRIKVPPSGRDDGREEGGGERAPGGRRRLGQHRGRPVPGGPPRRLTLSLFCGTLCATNRGVGGAMRTREDNPSELHGHRAGLPLSRGFLAYYFYYPRDIQGPVAHQRREG
jgi:hypothetical protein